MTNIKTVLVSAFSMLLFACNNGNNEQATTDSTAVADSTTLTNTPKADSSNNAASGLMGSMHASMGRMQALQMTGDFDIDFANMMIEHHQGAIDMAQYELANGKDETMKQKAQEIITKQTTEQKQLRDFLSNYKPSGMKHGEGELQKSMNNMTTKTKGMNMSGDTDKDFAMLMIQHHQDGISMMKMEVENAMSDQLKKMAQKGISDQSKDIQAFKSWMSSK